MSVLLLHVKQITLDMISFCVLSAGIGYAMFFISLFIGIYYNMILAWTIFYLASSFTDSLPWNSCDNWWNTEGASVAGSGQTARGGGAPSPVLRLPRNSGCWDLASSRDVHTCRGCCVIMR